ncbi:hypothetical protein PhCBS80983_g03891 [Powellomyces hirtus]|uniref:Serine aminopeptidase S33 domain-containing protein n=1 Tax=Powellomyces hirtus TaxID=109895 RepID=A0A507DZX3_9FUNG|nr:hypothetical protein PhCBS80983_g03891 [Powellomyces hirtus]
MAQPAVRVPENIHITNITITALKDDYPLAATLFAPKSTAPSSSSSSPPPPAVLINAATGTPRRFYANFATYLASVHAVPVLTYDYRGIGDSIVGGPAQLAALKHCTIKEHWAARDQPAVTEYLHAQYPDRELVLMGQSVGCHIAPCNPAIGLVSRYLFVSGNNAHWRYHVTPTQTRAFPVVVELLGLLHRGYFPATKIKLCDDLPLGVARDWARWTRYREYCTVEKDVQRLYHTFTPESAIHVAVSDDELVHPDINSIAFEAWNELMPNAAIKFYYVDPSDLAADPSRGVGHLGLFRKSCQAGWETLVPYILNGALPNWKERQHSQSVKARL